MEENLVELVGPLAGWLVNQVSDALSHLVIDFISYSELKLFDNNKTVF